MKKTVRTYTKRTVAVFMAALMLLTAWVFVAPQKAEAVDATNYTLYVTINVTNDREKSGGYSYIKVTYYTGNNTNTGNTAQKDYDINGYMTSGGTKTISLSVPGLPKQINSRHKSPTWDIVAYKKTSISIGGVNVWTGSSELSSNGGPSPGEKTDSQSWTPAAPKAETLTVDTDPSDVTIPKTGETAATTTMKAHINDQYGARVSSSASGYSSSASITSHSGVTIPKQTTTAASDVWYPTVTSAAQLTGNNVNTKKLTATVSFTFGGVTKTASRDFTITDQKYDREYYLNAFVSSGTNNSTDSTAKLSYSYTKPGTTPNGGTSNTTGTITKNTVNNSTNGYVKLSAYYGDNMSVPTGIRLGFDYKGMYTTKNAENYNAGSWTPSGTKLTATTITDTKTYYAAWQAKNVHVTYLNNDGSLIKESDYGKFNQKASYSASGIPSGQPNSTKPANPTFVHAPGVQGTFKYKFDHWEVVSAKQFVMSSDGTHEQVDYSDLVGTPYDTAVMRGDTVFQAVYVIDTTGGDGHEKYTITYKNGDETTSNDTFNYLDEGYKTATYPASDEEAATYTYTFRGWAQQINSNDKVYFQDWDEDRSEYVPVSSAQTPMTDTKVYRTTTWVAVYGRKYIDYTVNFVYTDRTETPDGYSYALAQNHEQTLHYGETIEVPVDQYHEVEGKETKVFDYTGKVEGQANNKLGYTYKFSGWSPAPAATVTGNVTYTAQYTEEAAEYQIKFVDYDGTVLNEGNTTFAHDTDISAVEAAARALLTGKTYRDDEYEYTFDDWDKAVQMTAKDNAVYTAFYTREPLYTLTYVNEGDTVGTWRGVEGAWAPMLPSIEAIDPETGDIVSTVIPTPERAGDAYAEAYTFAGWAAEPYDPKNPPALLFDANDSASVYSMPGADTTLYAQYTCTLTVYEINFIYGQPDENNVMPDHKQQLNYGDPVTIPTAEQLARADDTTYHYEFRGWDSEVSETCKGNAAYTALYRKSYVHYDTVWYNPDLTATQNTITVDGDSNCIWYDAADVFRTDTYVYNNLISKPYQNLDDENIPPRPDENHSYIVVGWLYKDTLTGTPVLLNRGDRVTTTNHMSTDNLPEDRAGRIELVPVFKSVARTVKVEFYDEEVDGVSEKLGTLTIDYGTQIGDVEIDLPAKRSTETDHYALEGWLLKTGETTWAADVLADNYEIIDNITVKAKYSAQAHTFALIETTKAPTFFAAGEGVVLCGAPGCQREETVVLPALTDTVDPIGRVKVKEFNWTTVADEESPVLAAAQSVFIINTADSANPVPAASNVSVAVKDADPARNVTIDLPVFNEGGIGSKTENIYFYATKTAMDPAEVAADNWIRCFNAEEYQELNRGATEANFSATVGDLASTIDAADGDTFIVYVKIEDHCGNIGYISSAPLTYDGTPPVITITSTDEKDTVKHCVDATIEVDEGSWFFVTKNGEELSSVSRTLTEAGEYTVIAYDEAGNVTRRVVEIIGSHSPKTIVKAASCTEGGEQYDVCRTCGKVISEVSETPPLGHSQKIRIKQPTCTVSGSVTITCRRCGEQIAKYETNEDLIAHDYADLVATGQHDWDDGVVVKAATCSATGTIRYTCNVCGDTYEDTLPIDENAHRWSASTYTTPATCTEPGETYRICRYNEAHKRHVADIEPTGHVAADEWVRTLDPTCTEKGKEVQYCRYHADVIVNTRDVDPLGHQLEVDHVVPPTGTEQGYTVYHCTRPGCDYTENKDYVGPLAKYTVTFVVEGVETPIEKTKGETITSDMAPATAKASDNTYKYTFAGWKVAEKNAEDQWVATETSVAMPIEVSKDMTVIATYTEHYINYQIDFLYDDGSNYKTKGYAHWNDTVTVEAPTKDATDTETFAFEGWKKAEKNEEDKWVPTGSFVNPIICKGSETYIAVFAATPITYTVTWADCKNIEIKTVTVNGGTNASSQAPALPTETTKPVDVNGHWTITGWDTDVTNVTENLVVRPVQTQQAHNYATTNTPASCTEPAKTTYTCACGYSYSIANGKANGHTWTVTERVNPTATTDGYELRECSVCHVTDRVVLDKTGMINLTIVVKDNNGNPVSGANVRVYDGSTLVGSGVTDGSGKAVVQVPEAKTYRIEIDGNGINGASGTITVDQNGRITGGAVPTVTRTGGGSAGCDCTCHKSGFWPIIFRFFHKIIKMITGEFRCCPDANY